MPAQKITASSQINPTPREVLTADRTYYVRTDGSDINDGLANTVQRAFLTGDHALAVVQSLDLNGHTVTIQFAAGTYTGGAHVTGMFTGAGYVQLIGDVATPSNVVFSTTNAHAISADQFAIIFVKGFKLQTNTSGHGIVASHGAKIFVNGNMDYGAISGSYYAHILAFDGGLVDISANYSVSGAAYIHYYQVGVGSAINCASLTITFTTNPTNFAGWFVLGDTLGRTTIQGNTWTNKAYVTGVRYFVVGNAVIFVNTGTPDTYLPGTVNGSTSTGGQIF